MRFTIPASATLRAGEVHMADLTTSVQTGPPVWVGEATLEIPFDREPSAAERALIRRRLLTRDGAHEARVSGLVAAAGNLATLSGVAAAVRLLLADALEGIEEIGP